MWWISLEDPAIRGDLCRWYLELPVAIDHNGSANPPRMPPGYDHLYDMMNGNNPASEAAALDFIKAALGASDRLDKEFILLLTRYTGAPRLLAQKLMESDVRKEFRDGLAVALAARSP